MSMPRLQPMAIADFEEGGLYVVATLSVTEGRTHSVARCLSGVLIEECSGYAIGWHEVQAGLRIDGFWDGSVQVDDTVLATITPDNVRPTVITTARVLATHRGLVWIETDDEQLLVLPTSKVERAEGIIDAV